MNKRHSTVVISVFILLSTTSCTLFQHHVGFRRNDLPNSAKHHLSVGTQRSWRNHEGAGDGIVLTGGGGFMGDARLQLSYENIQYSDDIVHRIAAECLVFADDNILNSSFLFGYSTHFSESGDWGGGGTLGVGVSSGMKNRVLGFVLMPVIYAWIGQYDYKWEIQTEGALRFECYYFF